MNARVDPPSAARKQARILVVDDEEAIRDAAREYLSALGYHVDVAEERAEAEVMLASCDYELLIADMRLTGEHGREGLELVSFFRDRCPSARSVLLTAYGSPDVEREARQRGVDVFLEKPVPLAHLARIAHDLVGGS